MIERFAILLTAVSMFISCSGNQACVSSSQTDVSSYENEINRLRKEMTILQHYADSLARENQVKEQIIADIRSYFN